MRMRLPGSSSSANSPKAPSAASVPVNLAVSAGVGLVLATALVVGGVHVAQGDQQPVSTTDLPRYSSK